MNTYFPNQLKIEIQSIDIYEDGTIVADSMKQKITETSGSFEETLVLTKGCKILLIKNVNIDYKITNGLEGEFVDHSEEVLLIKINGNIIPIPKMKQKIEKLENQGTFVYRIQFPI